MVPIDETRELEGGRRILQGVELDGDGSVIECVFGSQQRELEVGNVDHADGVSRAARALGVGVGKCMTEMARSRVGMALEVTPVRHVGHVTRLLSFSQVRPRCSSVARHRDTAFSLCAVKSEQGRHIRPEHSLVPGSGVVPAPPPNPVTTPVPRGPGQRQTVLRR